MYKKVQENPNRTVLAAFGNSEFEIVQSKNGSIEIGNTLNLNSTYEILCAPMDEPVCRLSEGSFTRHILTNNVTTLPDQEVTTYLRNLDDYTVTPVAFPATIVRKEARIRTGLILELGLICIRDMQTQNSWTAARPFGKRPEGRAMLTDIIRFTKSNLPTFTPDLPATAFRSRIDHYTNPPNTPVSVPQLRDRSTLFSTEITSTYKSKGHLEATNTPNKLKLDLFSAAPDADTYIFLKLPRAGNANLSGWCTIRSSSFCEAKKVEVVQEGDEKFIMINDGISISDIYRKTLFLVPKTEIATIQNEIQSDVSREQNQA